MATESPLFTDGSQTTADADLSAKQFFAVFIDADRKVQIQGTAGSRVYGILQNTPTSGQAAAVGFLGISKAVAGGTFAAGDKLVVDSSARLVKKSETGLQYPVAVAIVASGAANEVVTVFVNAGISATIN